MPHSRLASPSATRAALERHGIVLRKSLGQHFLIDDNIVGRILELAALDRSMAVLEIGPGIGTLTAALCGAAGAVVAVERDARLLPVLAELAEGCPGLNVVHADAVRVRADDLTTSLGPPVALVANLPYAVAATVVLRFFQEMPSLATATVMVQAEVADRMVAVPGGKDYGAYTVKLQLRVRPDGRFPVSRACFMPPPRVDSSVVRLVREPAADAALTDVADCIATAAFSQRRKTLRNSLLASGAWPGAVVDEALAAAGIDGKRRAESLAVGEYLSLADEVRKCADTP